MKIRKEKVGDVVVATQSGIVIPKGTKVTVEEINEYYFIAKYEGNEILCLFEHCSHLSGGDWVLESEFGDEPDDDEDNLYVLVEWPESQNYMEEDWFEDEASLADCERFGSSAYFIPKNRIE